MLLSAQLFYYPTVYLPKRQGIWINKNGNIKKEYMFIFKNEKNSPKQLCDYWLDDIFFFNQMINYNHFCFTNYIIPKFSRTHILQRGYETNLKIFFYIFFTDFRSYGKKVNYGISEI
jgi:hypothetical protein